MPSLAPSNMTYYSTRGTAVPASYYETLQVTGAPGQMSMAAYPTESYAVAPLSIPTNAGSVGDGGMSGSASQLPTQHRASSGAWNMTDDNTLLRARAQGQNWAQIQQNCFPGKTPNACRKRHERLMERKGADDWDSRKMERLAKEYMSLRKEIWMPLAQRTGEKWNVVEQRVSLFFIPPVHFNFD